MCAAEVDPHVAQRYLLKRRLGKGAYGIVWKAVDRRTGEVVAIKKIFDAFRDQTDAQRTFREIMLLQEFGGHPNIIRLLDVLRAANDRDIYLVFESMDTDLNAVIRKGRLLQDVHKRYVLYQLLRATSFLHSGNVVHRDQKPANVLLDANCVVKLCDFGLARSLSQLPAGPEGQALTEYVATRWYRAPEVLLSSRRYSPGVDMWSLGCILGEMLRGSPLFPGTSTLHQLELILDTIPPPSEEELLALHSGYSAAVLPHVGARPRQSLEALLPPDTPPEALDLLRRLLVFAPDRRLSAAQALQHPYVQRFHCPAREWTLEAAVQLPLHEGQQLSAPEYRNHLYQMILERRGNGRAQREQGPGGGPPRGGPRASRPPAHPLKPGALPQLPSGVPAQNPEPRPRSSLGRDAAREAPVGDKNIPRQKSAPPARPPPAGPGRGEADPRTAEEAPLAPRWAKPSARGAVPSLASQAAAEALNQVLIRRGLPRARGATAAGALRVPHLLPQGVPPAPRPGRRMFTASATQGAPKASLGGYSQAYGTIYRSVLGRLPLPPGPRA
ncbi:mitogen-activated protein kinase 15 isoform X8 [Dasypus novemcinctus]|uniref:mitogen-activated protein kinase 15 isoform X8 n=1 Tax=Dasypus novemcinctus TaxID=9361 RepID=UPI00265D8224|nr:mitogen-activated protein kinase 15 isoform X4 [Dasypus novemcinctus]